ncbi:MAG TPA: GGDEF domain-containing protein [Gemmatimonadales bacterium]|jgi:diguanylate cyclase (GGDEF)-like protein
MLLLFGLVAGGAAGFFAGRRGAPRRGAPQLIPPLPDDLVVSDTASYIAAHVSAESTFEPVAFVLLERCAALVSLPCALVMRERPGAAAQIAAVAGGLDARLMGVDVPLDSQAGRALTDGLPVVGPKDEKVIAINRGDRRRETGGGIAVPIAQGGSVYGAIVAFGEPAIGSREAISLISEEARKFIGVLVPAYLATAAARRAETDELTGLANRRSLGKAQARSGTSERASLIVVDIDHFKAVNDDFGHQVGDAALKHVSRILRQTLRPRDTAARIGGEEFAIWLPGADQATGAEVAERLRTSVAGSPFRHAGAERIITISVGVASYPTPIPVVENLMGAADAALYQAKRGGRNQVVASPARAG